MLADFTMKEVRSPWMELNCPFYGCAQGKVSPKLHSGVKMVLGFDSRSEQPWVRLLAFVTVQPNVSLLKRCMVELLWRRVGRCRTSVLTRPSFGLLLCLHPRYVGQVSVR